MKRMLNISCKIVFAVLAGCLLLSCQSDPDDNWQETADYSRIRLEVDLPSGPESRSLAVDGSDEAYINTIDILGFVNDGSGDYLYSYAASNITKSASGGTVSINADVKKYPNQQILVILVNSSTQLASANVLLGDKIDDALAKLKYFDTNEWKAKNNGSTDFTPFPMYGKSVPVTINDSGNSFSGISLCRMVARLDVRLKPSIPASKFVLTDARIYNRMYYSYIPYDFSGWDGTKATTVPTITGNPTGASIITPTVVYQADITGDPRGEILRSIYTMEAPGRTEADRLKATALVIGGKYDGDTDIKYYRVDIAPASTATGYVSGDILRNHHYDIEIQNVTREGYDDPTDAFLGEARLEAIVSDWNPSQQNVIFDKNYKLTVSREKIVVGKEAAYPIVTITTNYDGIYDNFPAGAHVSAPNYTYGNAGGWLIITYGGGGNGSSNFTLRMTVSPNNTGVDRGAEIPITAGNMTYVLKVHQSKDPWLVATVDPTYLMDGNYKKFDVKAINPWTAIIRASTNTKGAMKRLVTVSGGDAAGEDVYFRTSDQISLLDPTMDDETVTLTFTDASGLCSPTDVQVRMVAPITRRFAHSNVVMQGEALTFATTKDENATIPANSQGVLFQFGSLVGMSSDGGYGKLFSSTHIVFKPAGLPAISYWNQVPHFNFTDPQYSHLTPGPYDDFKAKYPAKGYDETTGIGDICRYISDKNGVAGRWRLPTYTEYMKLRSETEADNKGIGLGSFGLVTITGSSAGWYGNFAMTSGRLFGMGVTAGDGNSHAASPGEDRLFFPASGMYSPVGNLGPIGLTNLGAMAYYWTCTAADITTVSIGYGWVLPINQAPAPHQTVVRAARDRGFSVRCIRE